MPGSQMIAVCTIFSIVLCKALSTSTGSHTVALLITTLISGHCLVVGADDGKRDKLGETDDSTEGSSDGLELGTKLGLEEGIVLGDDDGLLLGAALGMDDGVYDGIALGADVGAFDGDAEGESDGLELGTKLGLEDGNVLGDDVG